MKAETLLSQLREAEREQALSDESLARGWQRLREAAFGPAVAGPATSGGEAGAGHSTAAAGQGAEVAGNVAAAKGASGQAAAAAGQAIATNGAPGHAVAAKLVAAKLVAAKLVADGAKGLVTSAPTAVSAGSAGWTIIGAKTFAVWVALGGSVGLGAVGAAQWVETRSAASDPQEPIRAIGASQVRAPTTSENRGASVASPPRAEASGDGTRGLVTGATDGSSRSAPGSSSGAIQAEPAAADVSGAGSDLGGDARSSAEGEGEGEGAVERAGAGDRFDLELQLIKRAKAALDQGHPGTARSSLDEHARRFPRGAFAEEREGLRAIALCRGGQVERGRQAAQRLMQSGSDSVLAVRIRRACGASPR